MGPDPGEITLLLQQWRAGDPQVEDRLFELLIHTMQREWYRARRWLFERLTGKP